jgi:hypothetical protein
MVVGTIIEKSFFTKNGLYILVCSRVLLMEVNVESIDLFFQTSNSEHTRKQRGMVLCHLNHPPSEYLEHPVWGDKWTHMYSEWKKVVEFISEETDVPEYNRIMTISDGENIDVLFYQDDFQVAYQRIDVMYGMNTLSRFPKLLYLPDVDVFEESYTKYYYEEYLDRYISCDSTWSEPKPSWEIYETEVRKYNSVHPFFIELKERESNAKKEKEMVVNQSISSYLETYGGRIKLDVLLEKFNESQEGKIYLLCCEGKFHVEMMEMMDLEWMGVTQNTIQVRTGEANVNLLLCWRNHKGVSQPSWKISIGNV